MSFTLRPWVAADLPSLVQAANNADIARYLYDVFPHPYTVADGQAYLDFVAAEPPGSVFAIDVAGEAVGSIALRLQADVYRHNAELGYWLAQPYWGRGIATQAVRQLVAHGFQTFALTRIFARPFGTNRASQRVLEKAGFVLEAQFRQTLVKNGELLDEYVYAVRHPVNELPG